MALLQTIPAPLLALGIAGAIALVFEWFVKPFADRLAPSDPGMHDATLRFCVAVLGALVGVAGFLLGADTAHLAIRSLILAALSGAGEGIVAIVGYHLVPVPATMVSAVLGRLVPTPTIAVPPIMVTPLAPPAPAIEQPAPAPVAPVLAVVPEAPAVV